MKTGDRITSLSVANFKSIGRKPQGISIKPLTILAGANSSGKSTLMQPLLLVKQTLESSFDPGPLLLNGPNVKFDDSCQLISLVPGASKKRFTFEFGIASRLKIGLEFSHSPKKEIALVANFFEASDGHRVRLDPTLADAEIAMYLGLPLDRSAEYKVIRRRSFLSAEAAGAGPGEERWSRTKVFDPELPEYFRRVLHVAGVRSDPRQNYPRTASGPLFPGTFEAYTASLILDWQQRKERTQLAKLRDWTGQLGLTDRVVAERRGDVSIEIRVGRLTQTAMNKESDLVPLAQVGFGVSQVLPVLVAMLAAGPNDLVYVEQPELHLRPNSQVCLASILAEAAHRGPSIVVETHSSLLIQEIQTLVATGSLDRDHVALHWCSRDPKTGATKVDTADLDKNGAYGEWPIDFDSVALESQGRYLDAVGRGLKH